MANCRIVVETGMDKYCHRYSGNVEFVKDVFAGNPSHVSLIPVFHWHETKPNEPKTTQLDAIVMSNGDTVSIWRANQKFPEWLKNGFKNDQIVKTVGGRSRSAIKQLRLMTDAAGLDFKELKNVVGLGDVAQERAYSLKNLCAEHNWELAPFKRVRGTDWAAKVISDEVKQNVADRAYFVHEIYQRSKNSPKKDKSPVFSTIGQIVERLHDVDHKDKVVNVRGEISSLTAVQQVTVQGEIIEASTVRLEDDVNALTFYLKPDQIKNLNLKDVVEVINGSILDNGYISVPNHGKIMKVDQMPKQNDSASIERASKQAVEQKPNKISDQEKPFQSATEKKPIDSTSTEEKPKESTSRSCTPSSLKQHVAKSPKKQKSGDENKSVNAKKQAEVDSPKSNQTSEKQNMDKHKLDSSRLQQQFKIIDQLQLNYQKFFESNFRELKRKLEKTFEKDSERITGLGQSQELTTN